MPENKKPGYPRHHHVAVGIPSVNVTSIALDFGAAPDVDQLERGLPELIRELGLQLSDGSSADWIIRYSPDVQFLSAENIARWQAAAVHEEAFAFASTNQDGRPMTLCHAVGARALLYSIQSAISLCPRLDGAAQGRQFVEAIVVDYPDFDCRGVIEGFYGHPYDNGDRQTLISLMSFARMNCYIYGPKDDNKARRHWRQRYDQGEAPTVPLADIQSAASMARHGFVRFIWSISPGQDFNFMHFEHDFNKLMAKIDHLRNEAGVEEFALFLDDILFDFGLNPRSHAELANRLQRELDNPMFFVGTTYHGAPIFGGPNAYTDELGDRLDPMIKVLWTGKAVFSPPMDPEDMARINSSLRRKVSIWDNWPHMRDNFFWRPHPFQRGSARLHEAVDAFLWNPTMNEWRAHPAREFWQVLGPQADYLWNPAAYVKESSFQQWQTLLNEWLNTQPD